MAVNRLETLILWDGGMIGQAHHNPELWIDQIFAAKAVEKGGVIRRSVAWVAREVGRDRFVAEVRQRGFHLFEGGGQYIVICNPQPVRRIL